MGAEKPMMGRLLKVFRRAGEQHQQALAELKASAKDTPQKLNPKFTPNQKLLQAAVAYANACVLAAPGSDPQQAAKRREARFQTRGIKSGELQSLRKPGTGTPLTGPAQRPVDGCRRAAFLPKPLRLRRAGNQHAAWFDELEALAQQLQRAWMTTKPWFKQVLARR
jgi:hypothetical protein